MSVEFLFSFWIWKKATGWPETYQRLPSCTDCLRFLTLQIENCENSLHQYLNVHWTKCLLSLFRHKVEQWAHNKGRKYVSYPHRAILLWKTDDKHIINYTCVRTTHGWVYVTRNLTSWCGENFPEEVIF